MTAIDFLVEKLKLESIDLSLWHQNLINKALEMERKQMEEICFETLATCDKEFNVSLVEYFDSVREKALKKINSECQCFRLGEGSPWQTYLCEIHKENKIK